MACSIVFVHAVDTTGKHEHERRRNVYADRCRQCFRRVDATHHVAAHVLAYPCCVANCCVGFLTLKTTCKSCNSANKSGKIYIDQKSAFVDPCSTPGLVNLGWYIWPLCLHLSLADGADPNVFSNA